LLTVTGDKLTNFRLIALDALKAVRHRVSDLPALGRNNPVFNPVKTDLLAAEHLGEAACRRPSGRYGKDVSAIVAAAKPGNFEPIQDTQVLWAELRWIAHNEGVVHLDDILLRRVSLDLLLLQGSEALLSKIRAICQSELGWDDAR
jgi:glycerol-3-phosphate dehydrogenase